MNGISLKDMSFDELTTLEAAIRAEKDIRESVRFEELVTNACDALNAIKAEYPLAKMCVKMPYPEYEITDDFDLFDLVEIFSAANFSRH